jgi:hypothetical protein
MEAECQLSLVVLASAHWPLAAHFAVGAKEETTARNTTTATTVVVEERRMLDILTVCRLSRYVEQRPPATVSASVEVLPTSSQLANSDGGKTMDDYCSRCWRGQEISQLKN